MEDEAASLDDGATATGISVQLIRPATVAALRYFDASGTFAASLARVLGIALPGCQRAVVHPDSNLMLAWRSPTETLMLCPDAACLEAARDMADSRDDGCVVDQTAGIIALSITGERSNDLLLRLGSTSVLPAPGEARTGRLAELSVSVVCVRAGEIILVVERVYLRHLFAWIQATLQDF